MTTFREKLEPRKQAAKDIGQNLVELAWLFFVAAQWVAAVALPIFAAVYVIGWLIGGPVSMSFSGITLMSARGIFFAVLFWIVCAAFAAGYLFKIRRGSEPAFAAKCILMALYASVLLMLTYKIEVCEHEYILKNIRYSQTTVRLFDAESKQPLEPEFSLDSDNIPVSILPTRYVALSKADRSCVFHLLSIRPIPINFSSPGYQNQQVFIGNEEGEEPLDIDLKKVPYNDPNAPAK